jgi:hypothetical protein
MLGSSCHHPSRPFAFDSCCDSSCCCCYMVVLLLVVINVSSDCCAVLSVKVETQWNYFSLALLI